MPRAASSSAEVIGQLLVIGFDGTEMSPNLAHLFSRIRPGGVIFFARNIVNAQQTHQLLRDCQSKIAHPLLACVDLEGGRVDRFRSVFGAAPSAADVFSTGRRALFRQHGAIIGRCCRALGFNVDLAPVLDLAFAASRSVMGSRAVSADPKQATLYAREFLGGLRAAGVTGAGKHFPGLGEGRLDSHHALPVIQKSFAKLWAEDLAPYRALKPELPVVLVSHANYPSVTRDALPASLSKKWMTEVLRRKIGFRGLIASDDMEMGALLKAMPIDQAATEFIRSGGDLCLICHEQTNVERGFEALTQEYERNAKFRRRMTESAKRIATFKRKHARQLRIPASPSPGKVERLSRQLWEFSERVRLYQISAAAGAGAAR
jgi:beta-N-acetylhexosaminidase